MTPSFSFLIPTHREDRPLKRCLDSITSQLHSRDEVLIIGDTADGALPGVQALVKTYGRQFRYMPFNADKHDYGHSQLNYGLDFARGSHIHCMDDDDIYTPDALRLMRIGVAAFPDKPLLFRFKHYNGITYWLKPGLMQRDYIGGHCLLAPNISGKVGRWGPDYNGDYDWIESTVNAYGGPAEVIWISDVICIGRPTDALANALRNQGLTSTVLEAIT